MNEEQTPKPQGLDRRLILIGGICALVIALAVIFGLMRHEDAANVSEVRMAAKPAPARPTPPASQDHLLAANATTESAAAAANAANATSAYEETMGVPLERLVRQVDYALLETLLFTGYNPHAMRIREVHLMRYHDEQYHFQDVDIELEKGPRRFLEILVKSLSKWVPEAVLKQTAPMTYEITVAGQPSHRLVFHTEEPVVPQPATGGKMAVIIDDLGRSLRFARELAELPFPVTFSVLPAEPHTTAVAALANDKGRELFLHLPMEPKGWPKINPGPGALFTSMTPQEIRTTLNANLNLVPGAIGANNHMGSKFTQSPKGMAVVLAELKKRNIFFLDSLTAPGSVVRTQARNLNMPVYQRNIFLDNIRDVNAIVRQLVKAQRLASGSGQAVAIGHPYPETLTALKQWGQSRDTHVTIVPVAQLNPLK